MILDELNADYGRNSYSVKTLSLGVLPKILKQPLNSHLYPRSGLCQHGDDIKVIVVLFKFNPATRQDSSHPSFLSMSTYVEYQETPS